MTSALLLLRRSQHFGIFVPGQLLWAPALIGLTVTALAWSSSFRAVLVGERRFGAANIGDVFKQFVIISLVPAAFYLSRATGFSPLTGVALANISSVLAASAMYLVLIPRHGPSDAGPDSGFRECLAFAIPSYAATLIQFLNYQLDVFFVSGMLGTRELGIYLVAVLMAQSVNMVPGTIQSVLFPTVAASQEESGRAALTAQASRFLTWFRIGIASLVALVGSLLIRLVFGSAFSEAVRPLWWLLPGSAIFVTTNVVAGYFAGIGKPKLNLLASTVGVLLTVPLDLLLIPRFGISGAALTSTISYMASTVVTIALFCRATGLPVTRLFLPAPQDRPVLLRVVAAVEGFVASGGGREP